MTIYNEYFPFPTKRKMNCNKSALEILYNICMYNKKVCLWCSAMPCAVALCRLLELYQTQHSQTELFTRVPKKVAFCEVFSPQSLWNKAQFEKCCSSPLGEVLKSSPLYLAAQGWKFSLPINFNGELSVELQNYHLHPHKFFSVCFLEVGMSWQSERLFF